MSTNEIGGTPPEPLPQTTASAPPQYDWQRPQLGQFEFGDVLNRAFSMLFQNFMPFFLTAMLIVGLPALVAFGFMLFAASLSGGFAALIWGGAVVGGLILILGSVLLPAAIMYSAIRGWAGEPVSMRQSLRLMLSRFWSLLGLGILMGLALVAATLLFIVPGVILYVGWFVAVPVLLMEQKTIGEAFSRAWQLTSGYKWQIFGIVVINVVIGVLVGVVFNIPAIVMGVSMESAILMEDGGGLGTGLVISQILSALGDVVNQLIGALFIASTYFELRRIKEGIGIDSLASVFD